MRFQPVEGILLTFVIFYLGYYHFSCLLPLPKDDNSAIKFQYIMLCSSLPFVVFLMSTNAVSRKRRKLALFNPLGKREHLLQLEHNFVQNTMEQLMVFFVSTAVVATYLEGEELKLIPLNALVFTVGRILFRVGYGIHPKYRGVGVWCYFSEQFFMLSLCSYLLYTRGLMFGLVKEKMTPLLNGTGDYKEEL